MVHFLGHGRTDNIFLVPMRGGIWTLCIDLSESEMRQLGPYGFPNAVKCISYLAENTEINASEEYSQHGSYQAIRRPSMRKHDKIFYFDYSIIMFGQRLNKMCFFRNAKFVDLLFVSLPDNFGLGCTVGRFWNLSTANQCDSCYRCYVFVGW